MLLLLVSYSCLSQKKELSIDIWEVSNSEILENGMAGTKFYMRMYKHAMPMIAS